MTEKDEEDHRNNNNCRFCVKTIECAKVGDHCHLTGYYRDPAHGNCKVNVTQNVILFHLCIIFSVTMIGIYF